MQQYRVSTPFLAVSPNEGSRFVTLERGAIIRVNVERTVPCSGSGLVDVFYEGRTLAAFMRDIEDRAERFEVQVA